MFCRIVARDEPAEIVARWASTIAIVPLNPVVPGHLLVLPERHVEDFTTCPAETAETMRCAASLARDIGPCNLITSKGREATQSILHMHVHLVPRRPGDELPLPWMRAL